MVVQTKDLLEKTANNRAPNFEKSFNVCRVAMRVSGILAIDSVFSKSNRGISDLKILYYLIGIGPVVFVFICETRSIIHFWELNIHLALEICTAVLSGGVVIVQGFCMYHSRRDFLDLISAIQDLWQTQVFRNIDDNIVIKVKNAQVFTQIYAVLVILLASSYTLRPFCLLLAHVIFIRNETYDLSQTAYPAIYPIAIDSMGKYIICISMEFLVFISVGAWWIAADMMFLQSATHLSLQYQILNDDLVSIKTGDEALAVDDYAPIQALNAIVKRHAHLLLLSEKFKGLFRPILMGLMVVTSANICICIINLQEAVIHKDIGAVNKCVVHAAVTMVQPAIYCIYANDLVENAESTAIGVYECNWVPETYNFKKSVPLITMRSQKSFNFRIYGFFNVDLNQLNQIGITAARFFALINHLSQPN